MILYLGIFLSMMFGVAEEGFSVAPHPRLLLPAGGEEKVEELIWDDYDILKVHNAVIDECGEMLYLPPLAYEKEGKRLLYVSREALKRIYWLSYAYRMTGEDYYAERARSEMLNVCSFPDWNPSHFLDVGEMAMAVAIGYDWLYDYLSLADKNFIAESINEKAFKPADDENYGGFYNSPNNWNQVCNAGLVYAALATYDEQQEIATEILKVSLESIKMGMKPYAPHGVYPEGINYWGYGSSFQIMMIAALETALGSDFGLTDAEGFLESAAFVQFMTGPSGKSFNFSDARERSLCNIMLYWCADKLEDESIVYMEKQSLAALPGDFMKSLDEYISEPRLLPSLMIFAATSEHRGTKVPPVQFWSGEGETPVYIYRSGWESPKDNYLGVKGGSPLTSHAHMDAGSFVYEYEGVRWSIDLGMQEYITLEEQNINLWDNSQFGQRWDIFRMSNISHSTLTVNGMPHNVKSNAKIIEEWKQTGRKGARLEMTETLGASVKKAERSVYLDKFDHLHVEDKVTASEYGDIQIQWVMTTSAYAEIIAPNAIILTQDGKSMVLRVNPQATLTMHIWSNNPPRCYDTPNPGTRRVGFTVNVPARQTANIDVTLMPYNQ